MNENKQFIKLSVINVYLNCCRVSVYVIPNDNKLNHTDVFMIFLKKGSQN